MDGLVEAIGWLVAMLILLVLWVVRRRNRAGLGPPQEGLPSRQITQDLRGIRATALVSPTEGGYRTDVSVGLSPGAVEPERTVELGTAAMWRLASPHFSGGVSEWEELSFLDGDLRKAISALPGGGRVTLSYGPLGVKISLSAAVSDERMPALLNQATSIAERLGQAPADVSQRLRRLVTADADPDVRRKALVGLVTHFGTGPDNWQVLLSRLKDGSPAVRLEAAKRAGPSGAAVLRKLVEDAGVPTQVAEEALELYLPRLDRDEQRALITDLLEGPEAARRLRGAELARRHPQTAPIGAVLAALGESRDAATIRALCEVLQTLGDPEAEPALLAALDHRGYATPILDALMTCGTHTSLQTLAEHKAKSLDSDTQAEIERVLQAMRSRLGSQSGRLAMVEGSDEGGGLSVASAPAEGEISLAEPASTRKS